MMNCLIFSDSEHPSYSSGLLQAARLIAGEECCETYLAGFHTSTEEERAHFDWCIEILRNGVADFDVAAQAACIEQLHQKYQFDSILFPATYWGRQLAPRLAMRLGTGLVADVTGIEHADGAPVLVRPAFDGRVYASIKNIGLPPLMASIRPDVFHYSGELERKAKILSFTPSPVVESRIERLECEKLPPSLDIRDSNVLVSGGGGTCRYFHKLEVLAKNLGGMVSASRRIVDSGIAERRIQVGHSGKTVSPFLYIALGIYGSLQHIEGLQNVETIISVNTNRNAPICSLSDIVVEGDAEEFLELLHNRINGSHSEEQELPDK